MTYFFELLKAVLSRFSADRAELSQMMIWVSAFAVAGIVAVGGIATVSLTKGEDTANCINNFSTIDGGGSVDKNDCTISSAQSSGSLPTGGSNDITVGTPVDNTQEQTLLKPTPDECFETDGSGTITKYRNVESPIVCMENVVIPEYIGEERITEIGDNSFAPNSPKDRGFCVPMSPVEPIPQTVNSIGFLIPGTSNTVNSILGIVAPLFPGGNNSEDCEDSPIIVVDGYEPTGGELVLLDSIGDGSDLDSGDGYVEGAPAPGIASVVIPNSVTRIGDYAFFFSNLSELVIPDSVTEIGNEAFYGNSINSLTLSKSIEHIGDGAFRQNAISGSVILPETMKYVGNYAFDDNQINYVRLPGSTDYFGHGVFSFNNIEDFELSKNLSVIPDSVFLYNNLTSVNIPAHIDYIQPDAFESNKIQHVNFEERENQLTIGWEAFKGNNIQELTLAPLVFANDYAFINNNIQSLTIADGVEKIGWGAFYNNNLTSLEIPGSVSEINDSAFRYNNISHVKAYKGADLSNYILDNNADEIKVEIYGIDKPLNSGIGSLSVASNVKFMFMDSANPEWLEWHYCTFGTYASEEDRISWCAPRGYA